MKIVNRKFSREFEEIEKYEAGIVLTGAEVKSIREGRIRLEDSFVKIIDNEPFLVNTEIAPYKFAKNETYDPKRSRKLLLQKKELIRLQTKLKSGSSLTIVPKSCYNKGNIFKLEIALVRGRRDLEKRKLEKARDIKREQEKEAKERLKI